MVTEKQRILIVESNLDLADVLTAYFFVQGYDSTAVHWGEDAVRACQELNPDLIILDTLLEDINGYEVARRIRRDERDTEIPIIFLYEGSDSDTSQKIYEFTDYVHLKNPVNLHSLRTHVVDILLHTKQDIRTNQVTGLPEGSLVEERLRECLRSKNWAIMRISLNNLDAYRECYGNKAADEVLHMIGYMIRDTVDAMDGSDDFLGHLNTSNLVLITQQERLSQLREEILTRLIRSLEFFYPIQDRDRGTLAGKRLNIGIKTLQPDGGDFSSLDSIISCILSK
jgi:PleD family two-component response regulator